MTPPPHFQGVLAIEPHPRDPGQHPETRHPGTIGDLLKSGSEDGIVTTELVDDVTGQQSPVVIVEKCPGAKETCQNPAAVNVTDKHDRQVLGPSQPHIRVVASAQVDLGRRPSSLTDHHVVGRGKLVIGSPCGLGQVSPSGGVFPRLQHSTGLSPQHDEGAPISARFKQHRIHGRCWCDPGCSGLEVLGSADFGTVCAHHRVV